MRLPLMILFVSLATLLCFAQEKPIVEISGAYQYDHLKLSADGASATLNVSSGWDGSVSVPIVSWFDVVGDVSRVWKTVSASVPVTCYSYFGCSSSTPATATAYVLTYGGGPQLTYRKNPYVQPFARVIFGNAHSSASASASGISASASTNSFLVTPGGGADIHIIQHLWFRVGADYLHTSKNGVTVNGVRALGGLTYILGGAKPSAASSRSQSPSPVSTAGMKISSLGIVAVVGQEQGAEIAEVFPNGVAALAALQRGDVINSVDGKPVKSPMELASELSSRKAGDKVRLGYFLHGKWQTETVVLLGENP